MSLIDSQIPFRNASHTVCSARLFASASVRARKLQALCPSVLWAVCFNGLAIASIITVSSTFGGILASPPYNWPMSSVSLSSLGDILLAIFALGVFGYGSDHLVKWRAKKNNSVHEPEIRLCLLWIPVVLGIASAMLYGHAAATPGQYHWSVLVLSKAGTSLYFTGISIVTETYLLDSYPAYSAAVLVVICSLRGFLSFGISSGIQKVIESSGYITAFEIYAGLIASFGVLGIWMYLRGKAIRGVMERCILKRRTS